MKEIQIWEPGEIRVEGDEAETSGEGEGGEISVGPEASAEESLGGPGSQFLLTAPRFLSETYLRQVAMAR